MALNRRMVLVRKFKTKQDRLHHETLYMTVESYAKWAKNNYIYNLCCLLPIGVLTIIALKGGIMSGLDLLTLEREFNDFTLPEFTLCTSPLTEAELFFLAHKTSNVPTFSAGQFSDFFDKIVKTRDYLYSYVLGRYLHSYVEKSTRLTINNSVINMMNDIEYHDFRGRTIGGFITGYLADLKNRIKNFGLIQKMAEVNIPVTRICHVFQSKWNPKKDIANQFVFNELGYNAANRLYQEQVTTSVIECVGSIDLCIQDPQIGYLGMRLNGFDTERPKSPPLETDLSAIICTPRPLYIEYDSGSDFTESFPHPDMNLHISCTKPNPNKTKKSSGTPPDPLFEELTHLSPKGNRPVPANQNDDQKFPAPKPDDINKPGPSGLQKVKSAKQSLCPTARHTPVPMFPVKIGPNRWVETQDFKFTKTNMPYELRSDMITQDGTGVVYINREGIVSLNGINEGYLGQDNFDHLGPIVTSCNFSGGDVDVLELSDPSQTQKRSPSPVFFGPNWPAYSYCSSYEKSSPEDKSKVVKIKSSQPQISRPLKCTSITDVGVQTTQKSKIRKSEHTFNFNEKPAENIFQELTNKQRNLNKQYNDLLQKFQIDIVNLPATLTPNQAQLINLVKHADDLAESLNSGTTHVKKTRETIIDMILELLQSAIGVSLDDAEEKIRRIESTNKTTTLTHRMLECFIRSNLKNIWQINPRPSFFSMHQDQKTLEMRTIFEKYTPTVESLKASLVKIMRDAERETLEVLNRPPTQEMPNIPTQSPTPQSPGRPEVLAEDSNPTTQIDSELEIVSDTPPSGQINEIRAGDKRHAISHRKDGNWSKYRKK